ncbi:unnamed protein product [Didymodactylos carnosus]|uniref:Uncharacterized protein n=1 Tax=Didymodactylos carnosus TaxID=1234261 RepID=A0A814FE17_9BILA|nr:unnamed protein product [Didymodactylos carnosus]CAF0982016.1 unnamed protein product [Didymodactylos carnosus]CAF3637525.1 unnamed protein product [Didymodactylos carnosus]CAF3754533.1 unnamed protein product [Didymodactylos carnosus]
MANKGPSYGSLAERERTMAAKRSTPLDDEAQHWIEAIIGEKFPSEKAALAYGVLSSDLFQTVDLFEKRNIPQVTLAVHALGRAAQKKGFKGPVLGVKESEANQRDFSEEQLRAGQGMIGLLNDGMNKGANQSGQNMGLSRHI